MLFFVFASIRLVFLHFLRINVFITIGRPQSETGSNAGSDIHTPDPTWSSKNDWPEDRFQLSQTVRHRVESASWFLLKNGQMTLSWLLYLSVRCNLQDIRTVNTALKKFEKTCEICNEFWRDSAKLSEIYATNNGFCDFHGFLASSASSSQTFSEWPK